MNDTPKLVHRSTYYPGNGLKQNVHTKRWTSDAEPEIIYNRIGKFQSGGIFSSGAKREPDWKEKHAELYCNEIRNRKPYSDARLIAKHIDGFTEEQIEDIRQHVFIREHLRDGRVARFDDSYEQAQVWQRLVEGKNMMKSDIIFLQHENMELHIMRETGCAYEEAHEKTNKVYNWYSEYLKEKEGKR